MAEARSTLECPVCSDYFDYPKRLTCSHVACYKCIVDWLKKAGRSGGCPLCFAPILPPSASSQDDAETLVDDLPTDIDVMAQVESAKLLSSRLVCMSCANNITATTFCYQCRLTLCLTCTRRHRRLPGKKKHKVDKLGNLSTDLLAELNRSKCKTHDGRLVDHFCCVHQQLICQQCLSTTHYACKDTVKPIEEAASEKRAELKLKSQQLQQREIIMRAEMKEDRDRLENMEAEAMRMFDEMRQQLNRRKQEVMAMIQKKGDEIGLSQLKQSVAAVSSHVNGLRDLVEFAPDDLLIAADEDIRARLHNLKMQIADNRKTLQSADLTFDEDMLTELKSAVSTFGQHIKPSFASAAAAPVLSVSVSTPSAAPISTPSAQPSTSVSTPSTPSSIPSPASATVAVSVKPPGVPPEVDEGAQDEAEPQE